MISNSETNFLYLAHCLPILYPNFFNEFKNVLQTCGIEYELLHNTKDVWAVDYMPIQIEKNEFVQFKYDPDYLKPMKYRQLISDVDSICNSIKLSTVKSSLVVDGGNVVRFKNKVIMCDKVFKENPACDKQSLLKLLKDQLQVDHLYFLPWDKQDIIGHADGMARFIDGNTLFINDPKYITKRYSQLLNIAVKESGLDCIELPCNPSLNKSTLSAQGLYINYLEMQQAVVVPIFNRAEDEKAIKIFESVFKSKTITTLDCNDIAKDGGVLNCISWNIKK